MQDPRRAIESVCARVRADFPPILKPNMRLHNGKHEEVARVLLEVAPAGAKLLDFGAGACEKSAIAARLGFETHAYEAFYDPWHHEPGIQSAIRDFAGRSGVTLHSGDPEATLNELDPIGVLMLLDVIEHLPHSPLILLRPLVSKLVPGGLLILTVPSAVKIIDRLRVVCGQTNYADIDDFLLSDQNPWRGHVREYSRHDLQRLAATLGGEILQLRGANMMLESLPQWLPPSLYTAVMRLLPGARDSWLMVLRFQ